jgi:hypothetical protein
MKLRSEASDAAAAVGTLSISVAYPGKEKELFFEQKNLIVKNAKQFLLSGIYLPAITSDPITALKAGIGGNIDPAGLYPKPEDPAQPDLIIPVITVPTVYTLDADNITVTFLADVDQTQANGSQLTEAGLFKASGAIFNVKNHPGINKTSEFSVHYSWSIKFL